jgi:hypothetical protein
MAFCQIQSVPYKCHLCKYYEWNVSEHEIIMSNVSHGNLEKLWHIKTVSF